jgi:hypothetical protein
LRDTAYTTPLTITHLPVDRNAHPVNPEGFPVNGRTRGDFTGGGNAAITVCFLLGERPCGKQNIIRRYGCCNLFAGSFRFLDRGGIISIPGVKEAKNVRIRRDFLGALGYGRFGSAAGEKPVAFAARSNGSRGNAARCHYNNRQHENREKNNLLHEILLIKE